MAALYLVSKFSWGHSNFVIVTSIKISKDLTELMIFILITIRISHVHPQNYFIIWNNKKNCYGDFFEFRTNILLWTSGSFQINRYLRLFEIDRLAVLNLTIYLNFKNLQTKNFVFTFQQFVNFDSELAQLIFSCSSIQKKIVNKDSFHN